MNWTDITTAGGDELRSMAAADLARVLADALAVSAAGSAYKAQYVTQATAAAARATYYLDVVRFGETAAAAIEQARDASRDGNFSTAQHLEAIETVLANSGAPRGSRLSTYEIAQYARSIHETLVYDTCDLMTLVRKAESAL